MQTIKPYHNESLNTIYNQLFCDMPELYKIDGPLQSPWDILESHDSTVGQLLDLIEEKETESRIKLLAYNKLQNKAYPIRKKELLAVILEVPVENGLDVLAAFEDGTARYINHSEKLIVWDTRTEETNTLINNLFTESLKVVNQIGPWKDPRVAPPKGENIRLNFLVSDGLYFGQGPFNVLAKDPMGGPVIHWATKLMQCLTAQAVTA